MTETFKCTCASPTVVVTISVDCFGTLVEANRLDNAAGAVGAALESRGVAVPGNWEALYWGRHVEVEQGAELPLPQHVSAALAQCDIEADRVTVRNAIEDAFEPDVTTRPGAAEFLAEAARHGPVAVLSNCAIPGLAKRSLAKADIDESLFAGIVESAECGYRKPDRRAFAAVADVLDVQVADLVHVGDDPAEDGGIESHGGTAIVDQTIDLHTVTATLRQQSGPFEVADS